MENGIREYVNYRPVVIAALALLVGVAISAAVRLSGIAFLTIACALSVGAVASVFFKKKLPFMVLLFVFIGFAAFFISYYSNTVDSAVYDDAYVEGRITCVAKAEKSDYRYVLEDVTINGNGVTMNATLKTDVPFEVGEIVGAVGSAESFELDPFDSYSMSYYRQKVRHVVEADEAQVLGYTRLKPYEWVRKRVSDAFLENMGEDAGGLAIGLVLGDKSYLSYESAEAMRASGLSHLLAVSGLHIGFLCALIYLIFRLLGRSKRASLWAVTVTLLFYGGLTGFPAGVVRATVMSIVLLISYRLNARYDPLNALALSVIIIVLFSPLSLFELGFQMSVTAVLGIFCFYSSLKRVFKFGDGKLGKYVGESLALSVSANSLLWMLGASVFGTVSVYFALANLVAVPYASLLYSFLVVLGALCLISPHLGILLYPFKYLTLALTDFSGLVSDFPNAVIEVGAPGAIAAVYIAAMLFVCKYNMANGKIKAVGLSAASLAIVLVSVLV